MASLWEVTITGYVVSGDNPNKQKAKDLVSLMMGLASVGLHPRIGSSKVNGGGIKGGEDKKRPRRGKNRCGICRKQGHKRTTCPTGGEWQEHSKFVRDLRKESSERRARGKGGVG